MKTALITGITGQVSSCKLDGLVQEIPQKETTPSHLCLPYGMDACKTILFVHESPATQDRGHGAG